MTSDEQPGPSWLVSWTNSDLGEGLPPLTMAHLDRVFGEMLADSALKPPEPIPVSLKHYRWCERTGRPWYEYWRRDDKE